MRCDGVRVKNVDMMYTIVPYIMDKRCDACNSITVRIPYEPMREYIHAKRDEGFNTSMLYLILAAYLRAVCKYPEVNRFVVNKRIYARRGVWIAMVIQRPTDAESTMGKFEFDLKDTIFDVTRKVEEYVKANRVENSNKTDDIMNKLTRVPGLLGFGVGMLKWLDKHGLLPQGVIDSSPFHCSMVMSNLASIRTNHIYHHIYDFGTVGQIMTIGNMQDIAVMKNGKIEMEKQIPMGIVTDERIASGYQYAKVFAEMRRNLMHPELLEKAPEEIRVDF